MSTSPIVKVDRLYHQGVPKSVFGFAPVLGCSILALAMFLTACASGSAEESPDPPADLTSADEVLAAAREAVSSVVSYRLERRIGGNSAEARDAFNGTISLTWSAPDNINLRMEGTQGGEEGQEFEIIAIDGRVFARQSTTGNIWAEYETDPNPDNREVTGVLATVRRFSAAPEFVPAMDEAELVGTAVIDGLSVYHVRGASSVKQEIPDENPDGIFDDMPLQRNDTIYNLYVSTNNFLPRRLLSETSLRWETSKGEASGPEPIYMKLTEDFLDYNLPVTIELPEVRLP